MEKLGLQSTGKKKDKKKDKEMTGCINRLEGVG